jgi:rhombotail lipoprotein
MTSVRRHWLFPVLFLATGCATGFNRGEMETALEKGQPIFVSSQLSVEEIERLRPQISLPIRVAVAPPTVTYHGWYGREDFETWSPDEVAEIQAWEAPLREAGVVKDLIIIPALLREECRWNNDPSCALRANRAAAARIQADALLVISFATGVDEYANIASVLNLTIVGMWIVPGHHRDALTIAEGAILDNRNEYLYAFARGEGKDGIVRPLVYADNSKVIVSSRLNALHAFGQDLIANASQLKTR